MVVWGRWGVVCLKEGVLRPFEVVLEELRHSRIHELHAGLPEVVERRGIPPLCAVLHGVGFMRVRAHQSILSLSMALSEVVDMMHTVDALWATPCECVCGKVLGSGCGRGARGRWGVGGGTRVGEPVPAL